MDSKSDSGSRLAVVIVVDGLRASALGAYGNTTLPTPLFDELASRSLVVEWLLASGPTLEDFYQAAVAGIGPKNVHGQLFTDDSWVASLASDSLLQDVTTVAPGTNQSAQDLEGTHAAAFFSQAVEQLAVWQKQVNGHHGNGLLWLHFSGLSGHWDAPLAMRQGLLDEDDPPAPEFVSPPIDLQGVTDPDELLGYRAAYAAQVSVIETCLAGFIEALDELPFAGQKLAIIVGARGFALGEHGCVGHDCQLLYSEQLHLPWLIVADTTNAPLPRVTGFAQPADIGATLAHWLSGSETVGETGRSLVPFLDTSADRLRDAVIAKNTAGESLIRTPAWLLKQGDTTELYAKPDDRWEANDVASLCPEIVEQLCQHLKTMQSGSVEPLTAELVSPWR